MPSRQSSRLRRQNDVTGIGSFATTDLGVQSILNHFGHPTQSVVKVYDDLASRVAFDVGPSRKGVLTSSTINDLNLHFEASEPLHLGLNPFLRSACNALVPAIPAGSLGPQQLR